MIKGVVAPLFFFFRAGAFRTYQSKFGGKIEPTRGGGAGFGVRGEGKGRKDKFSE